MGLRILWRSDSDTATITANSTLAGFPVSNVKIALLTQASSWSSDGTEATDMITMNMGAAVDVTALYVGGHNFIDTDTLTLRYASDSGFTTDTGTVTPTFYDDTLIHFFSSVSRQYWRLEILKVTSSETRTVSRFMVGDHTEFTRSTAIKYQLGAGGNTSSLVTTKGGQDYGNLGASKDIIQGSLIVNDAEKAELESLRRSFQNIIPFVACVDWENYPIIKTLYGRFSNISAPQDIAINHWLYNLSIIEQK